MKIRQFQLFILGILMLSMVISSCKSEVKQKIDTLPSVNLEDVQNIINNPQTAVKQVNKEDKDGPKLDLINSVFDFGTITQGEKISHKFELSNQGKKDLIILDTRSSCGCTVAHTPKAPISPNEFSYIDVIFDSKGKIGEQSRKISIFTNSYPGEVSVELKGMVVKK